MKKPIVTMSVNASLDISLNQPNKLPAFQTGMLSFKKDFLTVEMTVLPVCLHFLEPRIGLA